MTEPAEVIDITANLPKKDLYEVGEIPPLGHVPKQMYAWAIRRERHGDPDKSFEIEVVDVPKLDSHEVLVLVAQGVDRPHAEPVATVGLEPHHGRLERVAAGRRATAVITFYLYREKDISVATA